MAGFPLRAFGISLRRQMASEWRGSAFHLRGLEQPRAEGWATGPHDARPVDFAGGEALLGGVFAFAGQTLTVPEGGDPWNMASPSRRFAIALHRFGWLPELMEGGEPERQEALRLVLAWERLFGRWNRFSWDAEVLERRVFNLACAGRTLAAVAMPADARRLAQSLARQARHLAALAKAPPRAADQLAAAAAAGAALSSKAGDQILGRTLPRLSAALSEAVLADGGHKSRSPQAGMELLFDLLALEDGLGQRGTAVPDPILHAIERLTGALRVFTLSDGRLAALQGGETSDRVRVYAARVHDKGADPEASSPDAAPNAGYLRLNAPGLQVIADAAAPAQGAWSLAACGQPLAIEVTAGRDRLVASSAWSPEAQAPQALRLSAGASTVTLGAGHVGAPLGGRSGRVLGPRLVGGVGTVTASRRENNGGVWVEMAHDGWVKSTGLKHERLLFLDKTAHELRGEDRFIPKAGAKATFIPVAIYFHLHPDVTALLARDQRSVLLRGASDIGWWLRNDAGEVAIEASMHLDAGLPRRTEMVVLRARMRADRGGRVRWKLALAEPSAGAPAT